jgi:hypothetical protein
MDNNISRKENLDDMIDLYELVKIIWKGKFIISAIIAACILLTTAIFILSPVYYKSKVTLLVGKIGNIQLESITDIGIYIDNSFLKGNSDDINVLLEKDLKSDTDQNGTLIVDLTVTSRQKDLARTWAEKISSQLIQRHNAFFDNAVKMRGKISYSGQNPEGKSDSPVYLVLDSYNFRTRVLDSLQTTKTKRIIPDRKKIQRTEVDEEFIVYIKFIIVTFILSTVFAAMTWLVANYFITMHKRRQ